MEQKTQLAAIIEEIANELNITETEYNKAVDSYEAVGNWLKDGNGLKSVKISPQGSFNLGTVIKPFNRESVSYDIDLVSNILAADHWSNEKIKQSIGNRLKEHKTYEEKLEKEGKRCWTMNYKGFEMDILPATPYKKDADEIRLTHKDESGAYEARYSNPTGYYEWFIKRMIPHDDSRVFAEKRAAIEEVPLYGDRTPLQKAIQLLKRHRDVMFEKQDHAPISILITTLAARAYNNESNLYEVLEGILNYIDKNIVKNNEGEYVVLNPVMPEENFADKWNENEDKVKMFFKWVRQIRADVLIAPLRIEGIHLLKKHFSEIFGEAITTGAIKAYSRNMTLAREKNKLGYLGLKKGIGINYKDSISKVKDHSFYGKAT